MHIWWLSLHFIGLFSTSQLECYLNRLEKEEKILWDYVLSASSWASTTVTGATATITREASPKGHCSSGSSCFRAAQLLLRPVLVPESQLKSMNSSLWPSSPGNLTFQRLIYTFSDFAVFAYWSSRISFRSCCFRARLSWCNCRSSICSRLMIVACGFASASLVKISSGLSPHALMISFKASILDKRVLGLMPKPDAA